MTVKYFQISRTVPKKVCDGGAGSGFNSGNGNFGDYDYDFPRTKAEKDAEVFSDKQVNLKSGDAVNFG